MTPRPAAGRRTVATHARARVPDHVDRGRGRPAGRGDRAHRGVVGPAPACPSGGRRRGLAAPGARAGPPGPRGGVERPGHGTPAPPQGRTRARRCRTWTTRRRRRPRRRTRTRRPIPSTWARCGRGSASRPLSPRPTTPRPRNRTAPGTRRPADGEAAQETGPDTESAKDRLLAVLLVDPQAAVAALAAVDTDAGTTASDGDVTALLRAGLSPGQVARLVGVGRVPARGARGPGPGAAPRRSGRGRAARTAPTSRAGAGRTPAARPAPPRRPRDSRPVVGWSARNTTGCPSGGTCTAPPTRPSLRSSSPRSAAARSSAGPSRRTPTRSLVEPTVHVPRAQPSRRVVDPVRPRPQVQPDHDGVRRRGHADRPGPDGRRGRAPGRAAAACRPPAAPARAPRACPRCGCPRTGSTATPPPTAR